MDTDRADISESRMPAEYRSALFVTTVPITLLAFLTPISDHFRAKGWRVDALSRDIEGDPPSTSYDVHRAGELAPHFDNLYSAAWTREPSSLLHTRSIARAVRTLIEEKRYDVVHVHTPIAAFITRYAVHTMPAEKRPAMLYTAHGFHFFAGQRPLPHEIYKTVERIAARWTDYLITINDEDYQAATAFGTIDPARVLKSRGIGVDTEYFSPFRITENKREQLRFDLGIEPHDPLITMVAEFSPVKRHSIAFDALESLLATARKTSDMRLGHTKLLLVGEGHLEHQLKEELARRNLTDHVIFAGFRRDVADILCASDLLILTSEREGLPRSIIEALACGTPAIGTQTRGITDAIGDPALISGYTDGDELGMIAARVLSDPSYHEKLRIAARERALSLFSLDAVISFYDALYDRATRVMTIQSGEVR